LKLELKHVTKTFGQTRALDDLNITFEAGIYGILGPNGAGKSTMINLITDNVKRDPNGGEILYDGTDILKMGADFRRLVGYMPQQQGFYEHFSARAFLSYMAQMKGITGKAAKEQIDQLLEIVNLTGVQHKKVGGFSGGMKQRVLLAQALLGNPEILILDEPTAGLDPKERINIRNFIAELSKDKIILFATHVVSDIECIANQVLLMKNGHLVGHGTPLELIEELSGKVAQVICTQQEVEQYRRTFVTGNLSQRREGMMLRLVQPMEGANQPFPEQAQQGVSDINLEDVYLHYFGEVKSA
jgi:ABC-type multidrug transport system ATPase subunit